MLNALDLRTGALDVVVVTPAGASGESLIAALRKAWTPSIILSAHAGLVHLPPGHPAAGKTAVRGGATAYVCRDQTCSLPVTDAKALVALLDAPANSSPGN
jgi:hypothetical protein